MRFLTLLCLFALYLFGADAVSSEKDTLANSLFTADDAVVSGSCSYGCRAVSSGYITQIIDIDAKSGTSYCQVYSVNDTSKPLGVNANQTNTTCQEQNNHNPSEYSGKLVSSNTESSYKLAGAVYDTGAITFSRFLAGMCTLDPDIIDFSATKSTGILQVKDPNMLYATNISTTRQETLLSYFGAKEATTTNEIVASADSLNKANLGYFANLFLNMSKINQYLQNLTFVLVCAWFIVIIAFKKLNAYLEKKESNVSYLSKFYVPIIAVAFFYMPIVPQESNMSSSLIQIIIRNFMATSTKIADKAAVAGANTYLQKLYASVGANTMQGEATIYALRDSAKAQAAFYATVLQECKSRFPQAMTFQVSDADLDTQSIYNLNGIPEGITAKGCRAVERKWFIDTKTYNQQLKYADQIAKSFSNGALQSKLNGINSFLNNRQTELGWVNAALMPSAAILIELMPMIQAAQSSVTEDQKNNQEKIRNAYASNNDESKGIFEKIESEGQNLFGAVLAKLTYMIVPGASTMFEIFNSVIKGSIGLIGLFAPGGGKLFSFLNTSGLISSLGGIFLASIFIELILKYIPLVTSMLAGILAIIGWIIEVIKYFYVAPYVVSFSVTLQKTDKISEFLITGIVIFFKPILLVIFIYLGLFLYYLCVDVFVMFAKEQFYLLDSINKSFYVALILHITLALIEIISTTASVYFMWKVILAGPSYVIRLLGLNSTNDFIEPISQKLEKYSFT